MKRMRAIPVFRVLSCFHLFPKWKIAEFQQWGCTCNSTRVQIDQSMTGENLLAMTRHSQYRIPSPCTKVYLKRQLFMCLKTLWPQDTIHKALTWVLNVSNMVCISQREARTIFAFNLKQINIIRIPTFMDWFAFLKRLSICSINFYLHPMINAKLLIWSLNEVMASKVLHLANQASHFCHHQRQFLSKYPLEW